MNTTTMIPTFEIPAGTDQHKVAASVHCPVIYCLAHPGRVCVSKTGRTVAYHPERLMAALKAARGGVR